MERGPKIGVRVTPLPLPAMRKELDAIAEIEALSSEYPWTRDDLAKVLTARAIFSRVACINAGTIAGFAIFQMPADKPGIEIQRVAVHPSFRGNGIGRALLESIAAYLKPKQRPRLCAMVRETNTAGIRFFSACGLSVLRMDRDFFCEPREDGVRMVRYYGKGL